MNKSDLVTLPKFFDRYIEYVPDDLHIHQALEQYGADYLRTYADRMEQLGDQVYEADKWTIKAILQHIIDTERIFAYRMLRYARYDQTVLPGFDENLFADHAEVSHRKVNDLIDEFDTVRSSTIALVKSLDAKAMLANGVNFAGPISVLAQAYATVGHALHHLSVVEQRYFPLLNT
jgi:hypothetical protein